MFQHILVPLDESAYSERALTHAEELAKASGARLSLLVVILRPHSAGAPAVPKLDAVSRQHAEHYLQQRAEEVRSRGLAAVSTEVHFGEPADCIADVAEEEGVDLIVMSTHGLGATGRYALGSVALKVLMSAPCPVLMVRIQEASRSHR